MEYNFNQRKKDVLEKSDKSSKQSWDKKIIELCNLINSSENYYTTSSCAGRVVLMKDEEKKGEGLFLKVWHDEINFEIFKNELNKIIEHDFTPKGKFKLESPIIHIVCKNLESALELLEFAKYLGFRRSGISSFSRNIILELNSTEKIEFPIIEKNKVLVDDEFFKIVLGKSNFFLERGWRKIEKLKNFFEN